MATLQIDALSREHLTVMKARAGLPRHASAMVAEDPLRNSLLVGVTGYKGLHGRRRVPEWSDLRRADDVIVSVLRELRVEIDDAIDAYTNELWC